MNRLCALLMLCPALAVAQGVVRTKPAAEVAIINAWRGGAMTAQSVGGYKLSSRGFAVTGIMFQLATAAATATGTMTIRVTDDGAINCDWVVDCTSADVRGAVGAKRATPTGSCVFPLGSALRMSIVSACATAQPSALNMAAIGFWQ